MRKGLLKTITSGNLSAGILGSMIIKLKRAIYGSTITSICLACLYIFACWYLISATGSATFYRFVSLIIGIYSIAVGCGIIYILLALVGIVLRLKAIDKSTLGSASVFCGIYVVIISIALVVGGRVTRLGYAIIIEKGQTVITAITHYQTTNESLPSTLNELVPKYLSRVPRTGIAAFPNYKFIPNGDPSRYSGNKWILVVPVSTDNLTYDLLAFFPNQKYPVSERGRYVTQIGSWALIEAGSSIAKDEGFAIKN